MSDNSSIDFSTGAFRNLYLNAKHEGKKLRIQVILRRILAYLLKGIAVLCGIFLATGLKKEIAQILGVVVAVAVAIDEIFANHKRLIVMTTASYAYSNLFDKIEFAYNFELQDKVISVRDDSTGTEEENHDKAHRALIKLNQDFSKLIYNSTALLKEKVQEADLVFLTSIAQDKNKQNIDITKP